MFWGTVTSSEKDPLCFNWTHNIEKLFPDRYVPGTVIIIYMIVLISLKPYTLITDIISTHFFEETKSKSLNDFQVHSTAS